MGGLCGSNDPVAPSWVDQLGPRADGHMAPTGGPEARDKIFGELQGSIYPGAKTAVDEATAATRAAAYNPMWGTQQNYLNKVLSGGFLAANPYMDRAAAAARTSLNTGLDAGTKSLNTRLAATRQQSMADLTGQQAGQRSGFERSGLRYSTANQQAADSTKAALGARVAAGEQTAVADQTGQAATARAALEANLANQAAQGYQTERQSQTQAAALAPGSISGSAQLLQAVPGMQYGAIAPAASLVQGLAGGTAMPQQFIRTPGAQDYLGQVAGIAGMAGY